MIFRKFQYAALFLLVQFAGACSDQGTTPDASRADATATGNAITASATVERDHLVVAFGDSLYAGYNLDQGQGFAPELEKALTRRGLSVRVHNAGVSGDTSAAGLQRLTFTLDGLERKPDLAIVGLGGNDMLRGLSPEATRANLDAILAELKRRRIPVVLTGMLAAPNMGADYAASFNPVYPALARQYGAILYPFFLKDVMGHPALLLPDGIHPNEKGIDIIVGHVAPVIAGALPPKERVAPSRSPE